MGTLLIFGANGWLGSILTDSFNERFRVVKARSRVGRDSLIELDEVRPTHVLSLIGRVRGPGVPNVDYLEDHLLENVRDNLYAPVLLATQCQQRGIHFTYLGTGCIFSGEGKTEDSEPNFFGSSYSIVKGLTDSFFQFVPILNLRIRMPVTRDLTDPCNLLTKLIKYKTIYSSQNSVSVMETLVPCMMDMMINGLTGTVNLVNPGSITHDEILEMYKREVDPSHAWESVGETSNRSNTVLDTSKLQSLYSVPDVSSALIKILKKGSL